MKAYTLKAVEGKFICRNLFFLEKPPFSSYTRNGFEGLENGFDETMMTFKSNDDFTYISEVGIKKTIKDEIKNFIYPCTMFRPKLQTETFTVCRLDEKHQAQGVLVRFQIKRNKDVSSTLEKIVPIFSTISIFENDFDTEQLCVVGIVEKKGIRQVASELSAILL